MLSLLPTESLRSRLSSHNEHARAERTTGPQLPGHSGPKEPADTTSHVTAALIALSIFLAGVAILAWAYALHPGSPTSANYILFWLGFALCASATFSYGVVFAPGDGPRLVSLFALGAALWLPYYLRSPGHLIFIDELYHLQTLATVVQTHHTGMPVTLFPIPGQYPGLEFVAAGLHYATGLSLLTTTRLVTLTIHAAIPAVVYIAARALTLPPRASFIAAALYIANTGFYWFHAIFSYETLAILLFLSALAATLWSLREGSGYRETFLAIPFILALAVTHHVSSFLLALCLAFSWVAVARYRPDARRRHAVPCLIAVIAPAVWLLWRARGTWSYLSSSLLTRADGVIQTLQGSKSTHQLFQASTLPLAERLIDPLYPVILGALALVTIGVLVRRRAWRRHPFFAVFLFFGVVAWVLTLPLVFTPASDLAYRSWPFLFLGLAVSAAFALDFLVFDRSFHRKVSGLLVAAVIAVLVLLLGTSASIGDNQGGRFQTRAAPLAAGPEDSTSDVIAAAEWLRRYAGPLHTVVADVNTQAIFATYGDQRVPQWGTWMPFVATTPQQVSAYLASSTTDYIVVDKRITQLLPRYGAYFGGGELALRVPPYSSTRPFPADLVAKFDRVPQLSKIYDGGNIEIYARTS